MKKVVVLFAVSMSLYGSQYSRMKYSPFGGNGGGILETMFGMLLDTAYYKMQTWTVAQFKKAIVSLKKPSDSPSIKIAIESSPSLNYDERQDLLTQLAAKTEELGAKQGEIEVLRLELDRGKTPSSIFQVGGNSPDSSKNQFVAILEEDQMLEQKLQIAQQKLQMAEDTTLREMKLFALQKEEEIDQLKKEVARLKSQLLDQEFSAQPVVESSDVNINLREIITQLRANLDRSDRENQKLTEKIRVLNQRFEEQEEELVEEVEKVHSPEAAQEIRELAEENRRYKEFFELIEPYVLKIELPGEVLAQMRILLGLPAAINENGEEIYES